MSIARYNKNYFLFCRNFTESLFLFYILVSLKMGLHGLFFVYFRSFQTQFLQKKTVEVCGIRTWIVQVEGKQADHLTTTTAQRTIIIPTKQCKALQAT